MQWCLIFILISQVSTHTPQYSHLYHTPRGSNHVCKWNTLKPHEYILTNFISMIYFNVIWLLFNDMWKILHFDLLSSLNDFICFRHLSSNIAWMQGYSCSGCLPRTSGISLFFIQNYNLFFISNLTTLCLSKPSRYHTLYFSRRLRKPLNFTTSIVWTSFNRVHYISWIWVMLN